MDITKRRQNTGTYDVIVVGAGHAGIEAALCAARMGLDTALLTISLDSVGNMPCNPSVGGTAKGHLVYEIDALGGEMGFAADNATTQSRMLNTGKGAAVRSKRVQADRRLYTALMKRTIEETPHLFLVQGEVTAIRLEEANGKKRACGVEVQPGGELSAKAVILSTGTYLGGKTWVGNVTRNAGPDGLLPAGELTKSLLDAGIRMMRFKTGTPPRIHRDSIDFSVLERQSGDDVIVPFSVRTDRACLNAIRQVDCHVVYTNAETHRIIHENLHLSPLYSGKIHGTGPRYCPSIEDKVVRFADKERHQLFVEEMGSGTDEIYLQGFSSSLPAEVQYKMLRTLRGFEEAQIMRYAYAIEYDCCDPTGLLPTLEFREIEGLYGAGQFNGTSGYEEAASQGLVAGINAAAKIAGLPPLVLTRDSSYIGTLIDDLVTKGTAEPYRMMTSRSEFRLMLRQDNADARLTPLAIPYGLISEERQAAFREKQERIAREIDRMRTVHLAPTPALNEALEKAGSKPLTTGASMADLIRRPEVTYEMLAVADAGRPKLSDDEILSAETEIKYEGYVRRQKEDAARFERLENRLIPEDIDYADVGGLRIEARQKLAANRPRSVGQASRISGVNPADISVLLIYLDK